LKNKLRTKFALIYILSATLGFSLISLSLRSEERGNNPSSPEELRQLGPQRIFQGDHLNEIAFPLGGIGTGMVSLGGRGNLRDWEIFNRPGKGINLPYTFFAIHVQQKGKPAKVRILEGPYPLPFQEPHGHGIKRIELAGLPRMKKAVFRGMYPKAQVKLLDEELPISVTMEAFNPFIPLDPVESGIPAIFIRFKVKNMSSEPVRVSIVGSIMNPIGYDGMRSLEGLTGKEFGRNLNELRRENNLSGLFMSSGKADPSLPGFGTMVLATPWKDITSLTHWDRREYTDLRLFWEDFQDDGLLQDPGEQDPSPDGKTDMGSLGTLALIEASEDVELPFIISWNFPNLTNYIDDNALERLNEKKGGIYKPQYTNRFKDAWESARYMIENLPSLEERTDRFKDMFFSQTLPPYVLEALSSQASIIRTPSCFWMENGNFFGHEGCDESVGCCPLNCTHVWNYAQSLAFLFPSLERSMRRTDFLNNTKPDGEMAFRTTLPLGDGNYWDKPPAADGQMGRIISLYRDWQISGDFEFLKETWPHAKKALEFAWVEWDKDKDGIMEGKQDNTYDIAFYGPNSMVSSIYLGALLAGSKMAEALDDRKTSRQYRLLFEKGKKRFDELLWNGDYYMQNYEKVMEKDYQYGQGCLSDQLLGQWLAMVSGLGRFLPKDRVTKALDSVFQHNFKFNFYNHSNLRRVYALGEEQGLLVCSWPKGGRPPRPFWYSPEVWTGIEYQVASHLIYEGLLDEGLTIVRAIRDRHDGRKRNPWNEEECGSHYVRAMASWGVLLALTGFQYSAPEMSMGFQPRIHQNDFRGFWSSGSAWGSYSQKTGIPGQKSLAVKLAVGEGTLALKTFSFHLPPDLTGNKIHSITATKQNPSEAIAFSLDEDTIRVTWPQAVKLDGEKDLLIEVKLVK
jgi:non-lysosomal glucosylceramidase